MGSEPNEQLSAMVDDELASDGVQQALDRMAGSPDEQARWERYHLMGEVIRRNSAVMPAAGLTSRVSDALADEPHLLVNPVAPKGQPRPWLKALSGMAVAASVAAVAVFSIQQEELNGPLTASAPDAAPELRLANDDRMTNPRPVSAASAEIKIQQGAVTPRLVGFPADSTVMDNVTTSPSTP